ncbi:hypothetical protein KAR48_04930 [bacterium]|nr:hypothetical protein [bacterium]
MVDINLFKDEENEDQDMSPLPENNDENALDGLDDFDFDEPLTDLDDSSLDEDSFDDDSDLLDEETLQNFDDEQDIAPETDYDYGDSSVKRTPIWVWGVLAFAVVAVFVWFFILQPRINRPAEIVSEQVVTDIADRTPVVPADTSNRVSQVIKKDSIAASINKKSVPVTVPAHAEGLGHVAAYSAVAGKIVNNLTNTGQFAGLFLSGNKFFAVEYASGTKGVANSMAHRIRSVLGVESVKISPEEGHRTGGKTIYYAVISGIMPITNVGAQTGSAAPYKTISEIAGSVRKASSQAGYKTIAVEELSKRQVSGKLQVDYRIKLTGGLNKLQALLKGIGGLGSNFYITKMNVAPANYKDFKASKIKVTFEYRLIL